MTLDVDTPHGQMTATMLAGTAWFERDLISERMKPGLAAAKARRRKFGCQPEQRPESDRLAQTVLQTVSDGRSYRWIVRDSGNRKNAVLDIVKRYRQTG